MQACGRSGNLLKWLSSYLTNRHQFVEINSIKSNLLEVKYGVPKDTLVGPRLFSIYVNDFSESISRGDLQLCADDTTVFIIGDSTDDVVGKIEFAVC